MHNIGHDACDRSFFGHVPLRRFEGFAIADDDARRIPRIDWLERNFPIRGFVGGLHLDAVIGLALRVVENCNHVRINGCKLAGAYRNELWET